MKKALLVALVLVGMFFPGTVSLFEKACAQLSNPREETIYYEFITRKIDLPKDSPAALDALKKDITNKYNISEGELEQINNRAMDGLTAREKQIIGDYYSRLNDLPVGAAGQQDDKVAKEVASKYGISLDVFFDIFSRDFYLSMMGSQQ